MHGAGTDQQLDLLHDLLGVSAIPLLLLLLPAFLHLVVGANTNERERRKQTCQNQLAEGSVGNTHTHTYTDTNSHTYTSLTPRRVLLVMSPRKRRYSTSPSPSQYSCSSSLTCHPAAIARKMNHKCLVVIVTRSQRHRSAKSGSTQPDALASLPKQTRTCRLRSVTRDMSSAWANCCAVTFPRLRRAKSLRLSDKSSFCSQAQGGCH